MSNTSEGNSESEAQVTAILIAMLDHGTDAEGWVDSRGLGAYADALRYLARRGFITLSDDDDAGRHLCGKWTHAAVALSERFPYPVECDR